MDTKQKFKVYCSTNINDSVNKAMVESLVEEDKPLILEAIASSNSVDLDGDYMTNECLEDMKSQAVGLNIFLDHEHTIDKIVGSVVEVIETSSDIFKIKFSVLPKYEWYITDLLENNINLGLSIGASVLDFEETDTGWKIDKVKLVEISIVGIPANWDTYGTVQTSKELGMVTAKCFNGACKQIIDNLEFSEKEFIEKDIEDGEDPQDDEVITEKEVVDLINEACIQLKNEIITEIVAEFNLDGKKYDKPSSDEEMDSSEDGQIETDSSVDEDKEKNLDMEKEEIIELIKENSLNEEMVKELVIDALKEFKEEEVTETPIIKEEEVEVTKSEEEDEEKEEEEEKDKSCKDDDKKDKSEEEDESSENEKEEEASKSVEIDVKETIDIEELKKSIRQEIEGEILKSLSAERKPVAHEQPRLEDVEKEANGEDKVEKKGNVMSTREMAEHLLG